MLCRKDSKLIQHVLVKHYIVFVFLCDSRNEVAAVTQICGRLLIGRDAIVAD